MPPSAILWSEPMVTCAKGNNSDRTCFTHMPDVLRHLQELIHVLEKLAETLVFLGAPLWVFARQTGFGQLLCFASHIWMVGA